MPFSPLRPILASVAAAFLANAAFAQTPAVAPAPPNDSALTDTNFVANPSFEQPYPTPITETNFPGYSFQVRIGQGPDVTPPEVTVIKDPAQAHSGDQFLRLQPQGRPITFHSSTITRFPQGLYDASYWCRGHNGTWGGLYVGKLGMANNLIQLADYWKKLGGYCWLPAPIQIDPNNFQDSDAARFNMSFGPASAKMAGLVDNIPNPQIDFDDLTIECITSGLADVFGDHMVLQRDQPVPVWGWAKDPGQSITVKFNGQTQTTTADKDGRWKVTLQPMKAGGPYVLELNGRPAAYDVMMGDVWICSGQSNMEFGIDFLHGYFGHAPEVIAKADCPMIRLWTAPKQISDKPQHDYLVRQGDVNAPYGAIWNICHPTTVGRGVWGGFSAIGYTFGRDIQESQKVAVGLMMITNGGTQIESFMSADALAGIPKDQWTVQPQTPDDIKRLDTLPKGPADMKAPTPAYAEAVARLTTPLGGQPGLDPNNDFHHPNVLYNGMLAPFFPMAVRGAIWFQGEHNSTDQHYAEKLKAMITEWRTKTGNKDMPFIIGQLCSLNAQLGFQVVREQQLKASETIPHTALAVAIDCANKDGDGNGGLEIHFNDKQTVGHRMALAARAIAYGEKLVYSGPIYKSMTKDGSKIRIAFDSVGGGLDTKRGKLTGFKIAGDDKNFVDADAVIDGDAVVVSAASVANPASVRYDFACYANPLGSLYNTDGLPASPFRTDDWSLDGAK